MIYLYKILKKIYQKLFANSLNQTRNLINDPELSSDIIYKSLISDSPVMIARFGSTELSCIMNAIGVRQSNPKLIDYIKGKSPSWWWEEKIISQMQQWSGFFPTEINKIEQFVDLMLDDMKSVDILGSWLKDEDYFKLKSTNIQLRLIEPFWTEKSWMRALENKKVLIIHPFVDIMISQYNNKRNKLFENPSILPKFQSIKGIKAVQSLGKADERFNDWFEALDFMKNSIDNIDFDVCLIGAGAYGFPLAAHVKRRGKKAIHLGGVLQLLFGIIGSRWEDPNYGVKEWHIPKGMYSNLINENWVRPGERLKTKNANEVENACYW